MKPSITLLDNVVSNQPNNRLANSALAQGLVSLLNDATAVAMWIAPIIGVVFLIYFGIRKAGADETDQRIYQKRFTNALVWTIIAECAVVLINLMTAYFGG